MWTFKVPWQWAYHGTLLSPGVAQFAFGFYSVMLTSTILGIVTMVLFKPRSWCVYCPMGTMTQAICKIKNKELINRSTKLVKPRDFVEHVLKRIERKKKWKLSN